METNYFEIVFEDDYLIGVNKRSGLLVLPTPRNEKLTLSNLVNEYLKTKHEEGFACHRVDRDTSGLVLYAKDKISQQNIMGQFRLRRVKKRYLAIVQDRVKKSKGILKGYIKPKSKPPKFAVTKFKALQRSKKFSILEVEPVTGRSNQIRIHLFSIKHPIVGERKYAVAKHWPLKFKRLCLHAYFLQFRHPRSNDLVTLKIDIPKDMDDFLKSLGVYLKVK